MTINDSQESIKGPPQAPALRLMVVDDNAVMAGLTSGQLVLLGWSATVAGSGEECVRLAQEHSFDLIFMDIEMPGMDGFEAARRIRDLEAHNGSAGRRAVRIVAYSSKADELSSATLDAAGFDARLRKPSSLQGLAACVEALSPEASAQFVRNR